MRLRQIILLIAVLLIVSPSSSAEQLPIKTYTIAEGLARDSINCIVQDSHGFMWFCTPEGLSRFDGYGFANYGPEHGLPSRLVTDLVETRDGKSLPLEFREIKLVRGDSVIQGFTARRGEFYIEGVEPGEYQLRQESNPACSARITVPEREDVMVDVGRVVCVRASPR